MYIQKKFKKRACSVEITYKFKGAPTKISAVYTLFELKWGRTVLVYFSIFDFKKRTAQNFDGQQCFL